MDETSTQQASQSNQTEVPPAVHRDRGSSIGGLVLIVLGLIFLADNLLPDVHFGDYWPLILVAIGVGLLWKGRSRT